MQVIAKKHQVCFEVLAVESIISLLQFGFTVINNETSQDSVPQSQSTNVAAVRYLPEQEDTFLRDDEYSEVVLSVEHMVDPDDSTSTRKRRNYNHYSPEMRAKIGKYASENGNLRAINHFKEQVSNLSESTVRTFKQAYEKKLKEKKKQGGAHAQVTVTSIPEDTRGRPPILLDLDKKLITLLKSIRNRGGVVNFSVVKASALAMIKSNPTKDFRGFEPNSSWVRSVYRRCKFSRRAGTTTKPPVPLGLFKECKLTFLTDIKRRITTHNIPPHLVLNADQTPSSYVSVGKMTMATRNSSSVPIKGLADKRNITLTFVISLNGDLLPMQIIYQGKTKASQPRGFEFPRGFAVTQNPKHYSNELETLNLIEKIIQPYVAMKRKELNLLPIQKALLIWDVFKGQKTEKVLSKLTSKNIEVVNVPANMTHFFQPLDLTVNRDAKKFMKDQFTSWYSANVQSQLDSEVPLEDVDVDLRLSVIKPIHATWLVSLYNHLSSSEGKLSIAKGWKKARITDVVIGTKELPRKIHMKISRSMMSN